MAKDSDEHNLFVGILFLLSGALPSSAARKQPASATPSCVRCDARSTRVLQTCPGWFEVREPPAQKSSGMRRGSYLAPPNFAGGHGHGGRGVFQKGSVMPQAPKKIIAYRKKCQAKGTGLSHYILMDKKAK